MQKKLRYMFPHDETALNPTLETENSIQSLICDAAAKSGAKIDVDEVHDSQRVMQVRFTSTEIELQFKLTCCHLRKYLVE